jgi:AcrR family transcriptional regulator
VRTGRATRGENTDDRTGTRERLIVTAEELFARHGIGGVSIRSVAAQAGLRNQSAVNYYFGTKDGLVGAVVDHSVPRRVKIRDELLHKIEKHRPVDLHALARAIVLPVVADVQKGAYSISFLAQLARANPRYSSEEPFLSGNARLDRILHDVWHDVPDDEYFARGRVVATILFQTLADYELALNDGQDQLPDVSVYAELIIEGVLALLRLGPAGPCGGSVSRGGTRARKEEPAAS